MNRYYIYEDNQWKHKTPLKLSFNPILRKIQFFTKKPYVIASITDFVNNKPEFLKYSLDRVRYFKNLKEKEDYEKR